MGASTGHIGRLNGTLTLLDGGGDLNQGSLRNTLNYKASGETTGFTCPISTLKPLTESGDQRRLGDEPERPTNYGCRLASQTAARRLDHPHCRAKKAVQPVIAAAWGKIPPASFAAPGKA